MLAECCRAPAAAVTVIVEVVGWWGGGVLPPDPPLPQAVSKLKPIAAAAIKTKINRRRLFRQPMQQRIAASAALEKRPGLRRNAATDAGVAIVSVVETAAPEGVTVFGEKAQDAPEGSPEQLNEIVELKPFAGVTETVNVPLWPPVTVIVAGVAAMEKSGGGAAMTGNSNIHKSFR